MTQKGHKIHSEEKAIFFEVNKKGTGKLRQDVTTLPTACPWVRVTQRGLASGSTPTGTAGLEEGALGHAPRTAGALPVPWLLEEAAPAHSGLSPKLHWLGEDLAL